MIKTVEISGFGGSYEQTCQVMLTEGLKFLSDHPNFDWDSRAPRMGEIKIVGLLLSKSDDAKALDAAILSHPFVKERDPTEVMHQTVVQHLHYIAKHSYSDWIQMIVDHRTKKKGKDDPIYGIDDPEREKLVLSVEGKLP